MIHTRAAVSRTAGSSYVLEDVTLEELRPDEVLVRIVGAGMCHTDMLPRNPALGMDLGPIILGHEGSGVVEQVGKRVAGVRPGDHVVISYASCGTCRNCLRAQPAYCQEFELRNVSGRYADGGTSARGSDGQPIANRWFGQSSFADHAVATERNVVVVDPELPLGLLGPLGCGLQTGAGAVLNEMRLSPGQSVAVFGAGAVGLAAVMAAKLAGASDIVVVDLHESRLDLAVSLGATRVVLGTKDNVVDEVKGAGPGVDFSFETTAVTEVISAAVEVLDRPGTAVLVGAGMGQLAVSPHQLSGRKITYVLEGNAVPQLFLPLLISFWKQGQFPFDRLIQTYPLDDINAADADFRSGKTIKPVLLTGQPSDQERP
ncbi:NAD(P)-dependent alcohol dehydrogenase [Streptomyces sp. NPDC048430]|uniref:NAD(P)-dependent alcohol dehydrogenase n=1 Tax=Streptomyces sp. NPDC048430 TaxID=3155388 RepID=UPI003413B5E8